MAGDLLFNRSRKARAIAISKVQDDGAGWALTWTVVAAATFAALIQFSSFTHSFGMVSP